MVPIDTQYMAITASSTPIESGFWILVVPSSPLWAYLNRNESDPLYILIRIQNSKWLKLCEKESGTKNHDPSVCLCACIVEAGLQRNYKALVQSPQGQSTGSTKHFLFWYPTAQLHWVQKLHLSKRYQQLLYHKYPTLLCCYIFVIIFPQRKASPWDIQFMEEPIYFRWCWWSIVF